MIKIDVLTRTISTLAMTAILAGCSTLPRDGPTGRNVDRAATTSDMVGPYAIVELNYARSEAIRALPPRFFGSLAAGSAPTSIGPLIGAGDVLSISIFEPSGSLFGSTTGTSSASVRSSNQSLPPLTVDSSGNVQIPFAGAVRVAGLTTTEAAAAARRALQGKAANPQVLVAVQENAYNTVNVIGEIRQAGRAPLSTNADRLVDIIAARGGASKPPEDVQVAILRNGQTYTAPLTAVTTDFDENIHLVRGDQVNLIYKPRRFSTFGAVGAVALIDMPPGRTSLADAVSRVGGLDTNTANARSVLVFRFERPEVARALGLSQPAQPRGVPVVYRVNLEEGAGFFVANNFDIEPEDIVYVPRSGSAELGKFFTLVRSISGVIYDISVTNTLNNN